MSREFTPAALIPVQGISPFVLVCGDPSRAEKIAHKMDAAEEIASSREYLTFNGRYNNALITVTSHGVGAPGAAVCFEELIQAGAKTIIRVGSAGSYTDELSPGSLIIANSSIRTDGLTRQLVPDNFPAVADSRIVYTLEKEAQKTGISYKTGPVVTLDAFYAGVLEFPHSMYQQAGALGAEMEMSALFVIAQLRGIRAGGIVAVDGYAFDDLAAHYDPHKDSVTKAIDAEIEIALQTISQLAEKNESGP